MKTSILASSAAAMLVASNISQAAAMGKVTIDAGKTGEPVSKYIYGQFIEHLGRCIYGGIWAEMLQDRKFFHSAGEGNSPWKATGPKESVTMATANPFVGNHTPVISLAGDGSRGIAQQDLGLIKGKKYEGRVWLAGTEDAGEASISLVWGSGSQDRQTVTIRKLNREYRKTEFKFTAGATTDNGRLEITAAGKGSFRVGTVSLMPSDNIRGMRADTLALLKQLNAPVYRWPGGNFVSGYNWKDGIGDRDRRPPRKNPAWTGIEHNDMGLDEFMAFCRELDTEPYIAINSGLGGVSNAIEEVEYANAASSNPMGKLRAQNGHSRPYKVMFWGIGNEMYGNWQLGHIPLDQYVRKHNEFAEAMFKADPSIKVVGVGATGAWSEGMIRDCAQYMDLISEHFYCGENKDLVAHVNQIPENIKAKARAHRDYRKRFSSLKGRDIRIAMDEWNYWYGPHVFGELGTRYFLKDALGIAAGINEFARNSDIIFMANYAQTVNVIGCIKTDKTSAAFESTGLVFMLYRVHFGVIPVETGSPAPLNVMATLTENRKALAISIVNPTMEQQDIPVEISGIRLTGSGKCWQIAGNDPMAYNDPGKEPKVQIKETAVREFNGMLKAEPCSVTLYSLNAK